MQNPKPSHATPPVREPNRYLPEGALLTDPRNAEYRTSLAGLERVLREDRILEAPVTLSDGADKAFVEYVIQDYNGPMGVSTYRTAAEMDERIRQSLPDMEDMRRLLIDTRETE